MRIWKLDSKLKSFSLVGKVSAPGVVNSIQLLPVPKGFRDSITWPAASDVPMEETNTQTEVPGETQPHQAKALAASPFLLIAGLGQEHRLGRWLSVKEDGARNGAIVALFTPRTLGSS